MAGTGGSMVAEQIMKNLPELVQTGIGVGQSVKANKLKRSADALETPSLVDPNQARFMDRLQRMRRSVSTGTDAGTMGARNQLLRDTRSLSSNVLSSSANPGVVNQILSNLSSSTGQNVSRLATSNAARESQLLGMEGTQTQLASERTKDIQFWKKIQGLREAAELKTTANENLAAGLAGLSTNISEDLSTGINKG